MVEDASSRRLAIIGARDVVQKLCGRTTTWCDLLLAAQGGFCFRCEVPTTIEVSTVEEYLQGARAFARRHLGIIVILCIQCGAGCTHKRSRDQRSSAMLTSHTATRTTPKTRSSTIVAKKDSAPPAIDDSGHCTSSLRWRSLPFTVSATNALRFVDKGSLRHKARREKASTLFRFPGSLVVWIMLYGFGPWLW